MTNENFENDDNNRKPTTQYTVSMYRKRGNNETQIVEKMCKSSEEAVSVGENLLNSIKNDPHIEDGDYLYIQIGCYAADLED